MIVGIPSALLLLCAAAVYAIVIRVVDKNIVELIVSTHAIVLDLKRDSDQFTQQFFIAIKAQNGILRAICVNNAKTDDARERCVR
jgi:hypothetical protein